MACQSELQNSFQKSDETIKSFDVEDVLLTDSEAPASAIGFGPPRISAKGSLAKALTTMPSAEERGESAIEPVTTQSSRTMPPF